ncbi:hypothetical protein [Actinoplanes friuliensis]|jgi:hypothetical protein|uniref:Uncharacterized protein n=1 Tax=Actinoplanes friuliensis DSM 7358 TaxID=1246995 RepID=U5VSE3_9ACTN|nr:hypothetical protein [Actinoplanes friuliensis]AGZ39784.1 hypothetical protein AFR_07475 [Actinoplanes friuliensis DSM 7358]
MAETDSVATSTIAVHRGVWDSFCPNLPADVAAMVAPPVTVSSLPVQSPAEPVAVERRARQAKMRGNMPSVPAYARAKRSR